MTTKRGTYCRWSEHNPHCRSAVLCLHLLLPKPWNQNTINLLQAAEKWESISPLLASTWTLNATPFLEVPAKMALQGYTWTLSERLQVACAHFVCKWLFFSSLSMLSNQSEDYIWRWVLLMSVAITEGILQTKLPPQLQILRNSGTLCKPASLK